MTIRFAKSTWEETYMAGATIHRSGFVSAHFGICKVSPRNGWKVTHLPSGFRVNLLERDTLAATKQAVAAAESKWKWQATTLEAIADANGTTPRALADALRDMRNYES